MTLVRLERIVATPLSVPLVDPFVIASGRIDATRAVLVEAHLVDDRGTRVVGLGEGAALPPVTREDQPDVIASIDGATSAILGAYRFEGSSVDSMFAPIGERLDAALGDRPVARAAIEMAIVDGLARLATVPLHRWLGGDGRVTRWTTDVTLPILDRDRVVQLARAWRMQGFTSFKVKVGSDLDRDVAALEAIVDACPDATLRIDANAGFSSIDAIALVRAVERVGATIECVEQPCARDDLEGMAAVARAIAPPVVADESVRSLDELRAVVARRAADGVNVKVMKSGGLVAARAIAVAAAREGMVRMFGGMVETRLGMSAGAHVVASVGGIEFVDLDTALLLAVDPFVGGMSTEGATQRLGDAIGIGVERRT